MKYKTREEMFREGWIRASTPKELKEVVTDAIKGIKTEKDLINILSLFLLSYEKHRENKKATKYLLKYLTYSLKK